MTRAPIRVCQKLDLASQTPVLLQPLGPKTGNVLRADNHSVVLDDPRSEGLNPYSHTGASGLIPEATARHHSNPLFSANPCCPPHLDSMTP